MPRIIIEADDEGLVTLTERVVPVDLQTDHYLGQLVERIGWALADAEELERGVLADAEELEGEVAPGPAGALTPSPALVTRRGAGARTRTASRRGRQVVLGPRYAKLSR